MAAIPSTQESIEIEEFRERLKDVLFTEENKSEHYLIRWIRARDHDLDKAEELLRNHLKWREENDVDHALDKTIDHYLSENFPYWVKGWGKEVLELPLGSWDIRKALIGPNGEEKFKQYSTQMFEKMVDQIRVGNAIKISKGEYPTTLIVAIIDWEGYSYGQFLHLKALQNLLSLASKYEAQYPEIVMKIFFINCPSIFPLLLTLIKSILVPRTIAKISTFGTNKEEWKSAIGEWVEPEQLGIQFGGLSTDR